MPDDLSVKVEGMAELQAKVEQVVMDLQGSPMIQAMRDATMLMLRDAKINVPVNTGQLRASILPEVAQRGETVQGVVGSNVVYAPFVELGTKPHWPPRRPIIYWTMRKLQLRGAELRAAVRGIRRKIAHHGTKGQKYLEKAFEKNRDAVIRLMCDAIWRIISK